MGILAKLKSKMDQVIADSEVVKASNESLPSDEQLQKKKAGRKETAEDLTSWLSDKGFPTAGALAGAAVDTSADMIPETREDYAEQLTGSISPMGTITKAPVKAAGSALSKLKGKLPISEEGKRKAWNAMSGEERDAFGNNFKDFFEKEIAKEQEVAIQAAQADKALRTANKTKAEGVDLSNSYQQTKEKFTRPFDDTKNLGVQKVADVKKGVIDPSTSKVKIQDPVVTEASFPEHLGPSHQQQLEINRKNKELDDAIKRLRKTPAEE